MEEANGGCVLRRVRIVVFALVAGASAFVGSPVHAGVCPCPPWMPGLLVGHGGLAPTLQFAVVAADPAGGVVAATLSTGDGAAKLVVVRYKADGSLDPAFGDGGVSFTPAGEDFVSAVAVYGDGRIVVGGSVGRGNTGAFAVTRLTPDGSLDPGFGTGGTATTQVGQVFDGVVALEPLPSGGLVVAGGAPASDGNAAIALLRYRADGTLDLGFGQGGVVFTPLPEQPYDISAQVLDAAFDAQGRIVVAGDVPLSTPEGQPARSGPFLARYLADGSLDSAFGTNGMIVPPFGAPPATAVAVDSGGAILTCGERWSNSNGTVVVTRYRQDGSVDVSFGTSGSVSLGPLATGYTEPRLVALPDGSSAVFVDEGVQNNAPAGALMRLRPDGTRDMGFGTVPTTTRITGLVGLGDGTLAAVGGYPRLSVNRYLTDGTTDPNFGADAPTVQASGANAVALEPGDAAVTAGWAQRGGRRVVEVARFRQGGVLDPAFGVAGLADTSVGAGDAEARAIVRLGDGRLLVAGRAGSSAALVRYTSRGALDLTFGSGGTVVGAPGPARALALQQNGSILVAGGGFSVSRYLPNGQLDDSFGNAGTSTPITASAQADSLAVQPDGRILVAGTLAGTFVVVRLLADGALDPSFAAPGSVVGPEGAALAIALQRDGRIVLTGDGFAIARYSAEGKRDPAFGVNGVAAPPVDRGTAYAVVAQPDGKIAVGGRTGAGKSVIARVDSFGYIDETYGVDYNEHGVATGNLGQVTALALGNDTIVAAGNAPSNAVETTAVDWYVESGLTAAVDGAAITALHGPHSRAVTHLGTTSPALSPDGKTIAFVHVVADQPELYIVSVNGGHPRRLTTSSFGKESVALGRVSWSSDGRTIAFDTTGHVADPRCTHACLTSDVYAVSPDGSHLRRLISGGTDAAWSPDGKYLAYRTAPASGASSIVVVAANGSSPRAVGRGFSQPIWSPHADLLAYDAAAGLAVRRADGTLVRAFAGASGAAWAPDGNRLAALTNYNGDVVVVSLPGGKPRTLMGGYALRALSWSPNGKRIALYGTRQNVWALIVRDAQTGHLVRRQYGFKASTPPAWSTDSSTIYVGG